MAVGPRPVAMVGALLASAGLLTARWLTASSWKRIKSNLAQLCK